LILLDTNIVSETLRQAPNESVIAWLDAQPADSLYLCTPVLAELLFGVERLPAGARKNRLRAAMDRLEDDLYRDRILAFDLAAAREYARIAAARAARGRPMAQMDALIAAIAVSYRTGLATRNVGHFADLGIDVINPFEAAGLERGAGDE
jgi:predicted nucleic acid-binding protein